MTALSASTTTRDRFERALNFQNTGRPPVAPHWWGVYKYEATGRNYLRDAWQDGEKITEVYADFYERFKPDWFHLHIGTPIYFRDSQIIRRDGKSYLMIDPKYRAIKGQDRYFSTHSEKDEEIVDFPDYLLGSRSFKPKVDLSSRTHIDDFLDRYVRMTAREIGELGYADHVTRIADRYGKEVFITVHIPSAICEIFDPITGYIGFENGLMAFHDWPQGMRYLLEKCYEIQLEWAKVYQKAGAHAYIISESYISPDIANPAIYRTYMKGIHRMYFGEIERMGLIPICMFWGDVNPLLSDLAEINIKGLLIEESKKGFDLEVESIRKALDGRVCVFGNIDSIYLMHDGSPQAVQSEVARQGRGAGENFIIANGSPLTPGTPPENIKALIDAGKNVKSKPDHATEQGGCL